MQEYFATLLIRQVDNKWQQVKQMLGNNGNDKTNISADILLLCNNLQSFSQLMMKIAKLKCGEILSYAS